MHHASLKNFDKKYNEQEILLRFYVAKENFKIQ